MENPKEKKPSIGAWKKVSKNGINTIQFTINFKKYTMFENSYKTKEHQPDYIIYESITQKSVINE
jgi:hypothetical protein